MVPAETERRPLFAPFGEVTETLGTGIESGTTCTQWPCCKTARGFGLCATNLDEYDNATKSEVLQVQSFCSSTCACEADLTPSECNRQAAHEYLSPIPSSLAGLFEASCDADPEAKCCDGYHSRPRQAGGRRQLTRRRTDVATLRCKADGNCPPEGKTRSDAIMQGARSYHGAPETIQRQRRLDEHIKGTGWRGGWQGSTKISAKPSLKDIGNTFTQTAKENKIGGSVKQAPPSPPLPCLSGDLNNASTSLSQILDSNVVVAANSINDIVNGDPIGGISTLLATLAIASPAGAPVAAFLLIGGMIWKAFLPGEEIEQPPGLPELCDIVEEAITANSHKEVLRDAKATVTMVHGDLARLALYKRKPFGHFSVPPTPHCADPINRPTSLCKSDGDKFYDLARKTVDHMCSSSTSGLRFLLSRLAGVANEVATKALEVDGLSILKGKAACEARGGCGTPLKWSDDVFKKSTYKDCEKNVKKVADARAILVEVADMHAQAEDAPLPPPPSAPSAPSSHTLIVLDTGVGLHHDGDFSFSRDRVCRGQRATLGTHGQADWRLTILFRGRHYHLPAPNAPAEGRRARPVDQGAAVRVLQHARRHQAQRVRRRAHHLKEIQLCR